MQFRWQLVAAISILPFGAALADYADLSRVEAPPAPLIERTPEHESLIAVAQHGLSHATQSARELEIAVQNARRDRDMLLVTCLIDALETVRAVKTDATANLGRMNAAKTVVEARDVSPSLAKASKQLHEAMENAARCATAKDVADGDTVVTMEMEEGNFDPIGDGPGVGFPDVPGAPPTSTPPTIDVMEPGTDIPPVPPAASPMR